MENAPVEHEPATPLNYHPKFDSLDADLVLASNDGTYFRVPSIVMRMASGFFKSTLSLPRGGSQPSSETRTLDIIHLSEPARVVETLLSVVCCLGIDSSIVLATFDVVSALLFAAEKYEMPGVMSFVRPLIMSPRFLADPLPVYARSCRYGWVPEAKLSSRLTLSLDLNEERHRETLDNMHGAHLMALLALRTKRKAQLRLALDTSEESRLPFKCPRPECGWTANTHAWREFRWMILDEMDRCSGGETIKSQAFANNETARAVFSTTCANGQCTRLCFDKGSTLERIANTIDALPCSI